MRRPIIATLSLLVLLVVITASAVAGQSPLPSTADYPDSIVVIGHSGATGFGADPARPGFDLLQDSWATGTNPEIQSIYQRLLGQEPAVKGHARNLAIDGSDVVSLIDQAHRAVEVTPAPELVLVQSIDNDVQCDGTDEQHYASFQANLEQVLDILTTGLPDADIFFVSQWADVATYDRVVVGIRPQHLAGSGPCDVVDAQTGLLDGSREAYLQGLVDDYFGIITDTCAAYPRCRTDGGALQHMDLAPEDLASDLSHLSAAGHAKMAEVVWQSMYGVGGPVPSAGPTPCAPTVVDAVLPDWARAGFSDPEPQAWHSVGRNGLMTAVLFGYPFTYPARADTNNKILWVGKTVDGSDLVISAQRMEGGSAVGEPVEVIIAGGPGPSTVDLPAIGCWRLSLAWAGVADEMDLEYGSPP